MIVSLIQRGFSCRMGLEASTLASQSHDTTSCLTIECWDAEHMQTLHSRLIRIQDDDGTRLDNPFPVYSLGKDLHFDVFHLFFRTTKSCGVA